MLYGDWLGDNTSPVAGSAGMTLALDGYAIAHSGLLMVHLYLHELGGCHVLYVRVLIVRGLSGEEFVLTLNFGVNISSLGRWAF